MKIDYRCCKCDCQWQQDTPRPTGTTCPRCGHVYFVWLNYMAWRESPERSDEYRRIYGLPTQRGST